VSHKNVIELNGKLYDSVSGKMLDNPSHAKAAKPTVIKPQNTGVIDGFTRKSHAKPHPHPKPATHPSASQKSEVRAPAKHAAGHAPVKSQTLMRRGLKKPALHGAGHHSAKVVTTHSDVRAERAKAVAKSPKVSRFGTFLSQPRDFVKKAEPLHVKPAPVHIKKQPISQHHAQPLPTHNQILKDKMVTKAINDARIPEATTHKKAKKHHVSKKLGISPKALHFGAGALAALLLFGFVAYQNATNISIRIAATRAGFNATVPGYQPSGFGLRGPIEYGPGQVTINFKSNSDERNFHITQRVSNWTSESLLTNFVSSNNRSYQTYQDKGRTIYIYDGSNATWVSGGVWYQIEGNSNLSSEQLMHIASSI
jgi:hypothetical protein